MMDRKAVLGQIGEKIVSNYYSRAGNIVEHSIDPVSYTHLTLPTKA